MVMVENGCIKSGDIPLEIQNQERDVINTFRTMQFILFTLSVGQRYDVDRRLSTRSSVADYLFQMYIHKSHTKAPDYGKLYVYICILKKRYV